MKHIPQLRPLRQHHTGPCSCLRSVWMREAAFGSCDYHNRPRGTKSDGKTYDNLQNDALANSQILCPKKASQKSKDLRAARLQVHINHQKRVSHLGHSVAHYVYHCIPRPSKYLKQLAMYTFSGPNWSMSAYVFSTLLPHIPYVVLVFPKDP